jgi:hypothetical protein
VRASINNVACQFKWFRKRRPFTLRLLPACLRMAYAILLLAGCFMRANHARDVRVRIHTYGSAAPHQYIHSTHTPWARERKLWYSWFVFPREVGSGDMCACNATGKVTNNKHQFTLAAVRFSCDDLRNWPLSEGQCHQVDATGTTRWVIAENLYLNMSLLF